MLNLKEIYHKTGPGLIVAATGLGGGDIVASAAAGANYGVALLWAVIVGSAFKFVLNEGIGRWQLVTGRTLLEGWLDELPRILTWYFTAYLLFWTVMVAAAMMSAAGLVAYSIFPVLSVEVWSVIQAIIALILVWKGGYFLLENIMKFFIGIMFVCVLLCAVMVMPPIKEILAGIFTPSLPGGSMVFVFGVIGGVGGSVTLLGYSYWMREAGLTSTEDLGSMRTDVAIAYILTGLFGCAIMIIAAGIDIDAMSGTGMALVVAEQLVPAIGEPGKWIFLIGFWGAALSSMIGVWHGVPYLFANFFYHLRDKKSLLDTPESITKTQAYRGYLLYLCFVPMLLLLFGRPFWVIIMYAVTGAFFMPMLAALLLFMNGAKRWLGLYVNGWFTKALLVMAMILFSYLLVIEVQVRFFS